MDFRLTDEQQLWKDTLHAFMEKEVGREYTREHDASREFPEEAYRKIAERGWLGLLVPEELGGLDADPVMYAIFCEAMAMYSLDFAACVMWCSGAHLPGTVITILARIGPDRHRGMSLILVPNTTEGVDIRKLNTIVRRSLGTTEIFLTDAKVPAGNIIGEPGEGWALINGHLEWERLSLAASYVGNARTALDDTIIYTKGRTQFGRPLSSFQVLKHRMAENECEVEAATLLVYNAATKMARGERAVKEVSMAKVYAADVAFKVSTNDMQALGGYAQLPEYDMERYFREAKRMGEVGVAWVVFNDGASAEGSALIAYCAERAARQLAPGG